MSYLPGKLPNPVLAKMLARAASVVRDPRVLVGPRVGEDAAVLDLGGECLVVTTDPITFATDQIGWYAVQVNANDIAVRGARPRWFLAVLLLPERETDDARVTTIFDQIYDACAALKVGVIGGHTEITFGLERPIVVGQMLGEVQREKLVTTGGAQAGDVLLLTRGIAIEGTALLARELEAELRTRGIAETFIRRAQNLLFEPGISVVSAALAANQVALLHAMHDPTEGGIATGLAELAEASEVGLWIEGEAIRVLPETETLCGLFGLDPLGTLASGALLIAVAPSDAQRVVEALRRLDIECQEIGRVVPRAEGLQLNTRHGVVPLPRFARDELTRVL